ncbi:hypothetical protein RIR_jg6025.t1 [Rhizophagus irregularis DAOM 181602=DAOM 197198]|nr:hypothetical protein RIR_jg6025.t1 [Rhizophagus irregularis DAOM 181602=DAOM 197198]
MSALFFSLAVLCKNDYVFNASRQFSCIRETVFLNWDHRKGIERVYSRFQFVRRETQIYHCERLFGYGPGQTYFKKEGFIFSLTHGSFCELGESLQC